MRLLLIRHGQTPGNVLGQLDTAHPGPGLTELGERQAEALARVPGERADPALYASTLIRTQITAAPLARVHGLETEVLEGLQEIEAGSLEKLHGPRIAQALHRHHFCLGGRRAGPPDAGRSQRPGLL